MRIVRVRVVYGWRHDSVAAHYDLASACDGDLYLTGVRPSHQRWAKAEAYRRQYAQDRAFRDKAKARIYAWRDKKRAERDALRRANGLPCPVDRSHSVGRRKQRTAADRRCRHFHPLPDTAS